jgi:predicted DCC family thiol-disulfide oxidoreductase YuxK
MAQSRTQADAGAEAPALHHAGPHLVLYDGQCGLCNRVVQFVLQHDRREVFRFAWLQSDEGPLNTVLVVPDFQSNSTARPGLKTRASTAELLDRSEAALFLARELGWPWKAATIFRFIPKALRDRLYDFVAHHRFAVFGRSEQCQLPRPEWRHRFIDGHLS